MRWPVRPLGEISDTALGKMLDKGKRRGLPQVPYLRNVNVQWGRVDTDDLLTMELADDDRERFGVRQGDLLVCEGGEIGRCAVWHGQADYIAYQKALHRIRPSESLDVRFLRYLLEHQSLNGTLKSLATGSTIAHLPQQQLRRIPVPLPQLDEQRRIVDLLEDQFSRLEAAESYLRSALKRLKALIANVHASLHVGQPLSMRALAVDSGYGTSEKCVPNGLGAAVVRIPNLVGGQIDLSDQKRVQNAQADMSAYMLAPGDLLIVRTNGSVDLIGRSAVVQPGIDAAFASYLIRYRVRDDVVRPRWVQIMLSTPQVRARIESLAASSAGQHNLSLSKLDSLNLPVPPITVQDAGIRRVVEIELNASRLAMSIGACRSRAAWLRSSILTAAFSGRILPKNPLLLNEELIDA